MKKICEVCDYEHGDRRCDEKVKDCPKGKEQGVPPPDGICLMCGKIHSA